MKKLFVLVTFAILSAHAFGLNIRIIESQSFMSGHQMDVVWQGIATSMGHTPTISPQTTLDNTSFFGTTDVLIVSSGVISLTAARVNTIQQFVQTGKPVYIQSEYLCNYSSNVAFSTIVNALGGTLTWGNTTSGDLQPMTVVGSMGSSPNSAPSIGYYWYGCYGTAGGTVSAFLQRGGLSYGFMYCPSNAAYGRMATTTDQDWVNQSSNTNLLRNILSHLITPISCIVLPEININLSAEPQADNSVKLSWDPDGLEWTDLLPPLFQLERSFNGGEDFEVMYSTANRQNREFIDQPDVFSREIQYRMRIVDGNGTSFHSNIATARLTAPEDALSMQLRPVPLKQGEDLHVRIVAGAAQSGQLEIFDLRGALVSPSRPVSLLAGEQSITLDVQDLRVGMYLLRLSTPKASLSEQLLIH